MKLVTRDTSSRPQLPGTGVASRGLSIRSGQWYAFVSCVVVSSIPHRSARPGCRSAVPGRRSSVAWWALETWKAEDQALSSSQGRTTRRSDQRPPCTESQFRALGSLLKTHDEEGFSSSHLSSEKEKNPTRMHDDSRMSMSDLWIERDSRSRYRWIAVHRNLAADIELCWAASGWACVWCVAPAARMA